MAEAELHQAKSALEELRTQLSAAQDEVKILKVLNARGDAELRRAQGALTASKDAASVQMVMEERDVLREQIGALQGLLRENAGELEKLKALVADDGAASAPAAAPEAVAALRSRYEELQGEVAEAEGGGGDGEALEALRLELADVSAALESGSEEEVRRTRLRERAAKAAKEERAALEAAVATQTAAAEAAAAELAAAQARAGADLEAVFSKVAGKEEELAQCRGELVSAKEAVAMLKAQVDELSDAAVEARAGADAAKATVQGEMQRVLREAAEAHASEVARLKAAHKEELAAAATAASGSAAAAADAAAAEKVTLLEERVTALTQAAADAEAGAKAAAGAVEDARKRGDGLERKWTESREEAAAAASRASNAEAAAAAATSRAEDAEGVAAAAQQRVGVLEEEVESATAALQEATAARDEAEAEAAAATNAAGSAEAAAAELRTALAAAEAERDEAQGALGEARAALEALQEQLDSVSSDHRVAVKQHRQLKKDLGSELAKASAKVAALSEERDALAGRVAAAEAAAATALVAPPALPPAPSSPRPLQRMHSTGHMSAGRGASAPLRPRSLPSTAPAPGRGQPARSGGGGGGVLGGFMRALAAPPTAAPGSGGLAGLGPAAASRGAPGGRPAAPRGPLSPSDPATVTLLGQRLTEVLTTNEQLRGRLGMLEGIVQDLSAELESKRTLLRGMTGASGKGGAGPASAATEDAAAADAATALAVELGLDGAAIALVQAAAGDENAVQTLSSLLFKHMAEGNRLRKDIATLAAASA